jgi:elongation factor Tu
MLSIKKLMETVDSYIAQPQSNLENPFLLSVEGSLVVRGRGTVVTGKVEHGQLSVNDE